MNVVARLQCPVFIAGNVNTICLVVVDSNTTYVQNRSANSTCT